MSARRMHPDEVAVDTSLVGRLVAAQFPQWAGLPLQPVPSGGTDNVLFRLGEDMVVRLPRTGRTSATLEKERRWLPRLAPLLPVAVPVPLAEGLPGDGYPFPWSVYAWLNGDDAATAGDVDARALGTDLAQFLAALQAIDTTGGPRPGAHNFFRGVPLARRDAATRAAIAALEAELDVDAATAEWEAALRAPRRQGPPVWIHGDLDSRNVLVENARLTAVLDFGGLGVGDPACDVAVAWKVLPPETRESFRAALAIDDPTWARSRGWALSQAVNALSYYTSETNPVLVRQARLWLREVLGDGHRRTCTSA